MFVPMARLTATLKFRGRLTPGLLCAFAASPVVRYEASRKKCLLPPRWC